MVSENTHRVLRSAGLLAALERAGIALIIPTAEADFAAIRRSGCVAMFFGIESGSQRILDGMPEGAWQADDRKVVLPPRHELHTSMESLIHHFKIVTEGFRVPEGEVYTAIESPRGELGCYVCSEGGPKPWRVKFRAPSFVALQATATCMTDALIADMIAIVGSLDGVMGEVDR